MKVSSRPNLRPNLYLALVHYPVVNKSGEIIVSAVTNLDLHDIARAAKTFGVRKVFITTPLVDQQALVREIVEHWTLGGGAEYNALRKDALEMIEITTSLEDAVGWIEKACSTKPRVIVTSARAAEKETGFEEVRNLLGSGEPHLLVFGTAWGLAENVLDQADVRLEPICGQTKYNHLSVRSAVAIILDRLLSESR